MPRPDMAGLEIRGFAVRFLIAVLLAFVLFTPGLAHAESYVIDSGPQKGVVGYDGIRCIGEATYQGHSFRYVVYVGADADEMSGNPARERAWQESECRYSLMSETSYGSMVNWIRRPYDGELCLLWHPDARLRGVDEPEDLYCYKKPAFPDFDPKIIKMTIERV